MFNICEANVRFYGLRQYANGFMINDGFSIKLKDATKFTKAASLPSFAFLDAPPHLNMRMCPSFRPSVGPQRLFLTPARRILSRVSGLVFLYYAGLQGRVTLITWHSFLSNTRGRKQGQVISLSLSLVPES